MPAKIGLIAALSATLSGCMVLSVAGTAFSTAASAAETVIETGVGFVIKGVARAVWASDEDKSKAPVEDKSKAE